MGNVGFCIFRASAIQGIKSEDGLASAAAFFFGTKVSLNLIKVQC